MAYTKEQWTRAKCLFELGKSLQEITDECNFKDKSTISRRAKKDNWIKHKTQQLKTELMGIDEENATLDAKKTKALQKLAKLEDYEITIIDQVIENETGNKSLLFSTANLALIRNNQLLTKNVTYEKINVGDGVQQLKPRALNSTDIKNIIDSTDKAGMTIGIIPRGSQTQINNTNAQQNNIEIEIK